MASLQSLAKENLTGRLDLATGTSGNALEKSKSDSRLNNKCGGEGGRGGPGDRDSALSMVLDAGDNDVEDLIKRSVSQNVIQSGKKSPKKSTKKSKSYSKLGEVDADGNACSPTGHLVVVAANKNSGSEMKLMKRLKRSPMARLKKSAMRGKEEVLVVEVTEEGATGRVSTELQEISVSSVTGADGELDGYEEDEEDTSLESDILPVTSLQEYSILGQCIKQYETFYQVFVSRQLFTLLEGVKSSTNRETTRDDNSMTAERQSIDDTFEGDSVLDEYAPNTLFQLRDHIVVDSQRENQHRVHRIDAIFETLLVECEETQRELNRLLEESILVNGGGEQSRLRIVGDRKESKSGRVDPKLVRKLMELKLYESLRSALKLASNLLVELSTFPNYNQHVVDDGADASADCLPAWLRVLAIGSCYLRGDKDIQINCISTLFELVSLLQSQYEPQTTGVSHNHPGVTSVVMLPLMRVTHIRVMERETRVFQLLTSVLWDYLADDTVDRFQVTSLLYQLHASLERSGTVEAVISHRLTNTHLNWQFECEKRDEDDDDEEEEDGEDDDQEEAERERHSDSDEGNQGRRRRSGRLDRYSSGRMERVKILCPVPVPSLVTCNDFLGESETAAFRKFELLWHLGRDRMTRGFDKILMQVSFNNI